MSGEQKKIRTKTPLGQGRSCHQCKSIARTDQLAFCTKETESKRRKGRTRRKRRCLKKYCRACLFKFYGVHLEDIDVPSWVCPSCRDSCACVPCCRIYARNRHQKEKKKLDKQARFQQEHLIQLHMQNLQAQQRSQVSLQERLNTIASLPPAYTLQAMKFAEQLGLLLQSNPTSNSVNANNPLSEPAVTVNSDDLKKLKQSLLLAQLEKQHQMQTIQFLKKRLQFQQQLQQQTQRVHAQANLPVPLPINQCSQLLRQTQQQYPVHQLSNNIPEGNAKIHYPHGKNTSQTNKNFGHNGNGEAEDTVYPMSIAQPQRRVNHSSTAEHFLPSSSPLITVSTSPCVSSGDKPIIKADGSMYVSPLVSHVPFHLDRSSDASDALIPDDPSDDFIDTAQVKLSSGSSIAHLAQLDRLMKAAAPQDTSRTPQCVASEVIPDHANISTSPGHRSGHRFASQRLSPMQSASTSSSILSQPSSTPAASYTGLSPSMHPRTRFRGASQPVSSSYFTFNHSPNDFTGSSSQIATEETDSDASGRADDVTITKTKPRIPAQYPFPSNSLGTNSNLVSSFTDANSYRKKSSGISPTPDYFRRMHSNNLLDYSPQLQYDDLASDTSNPHRRSPGVSPLFHTRFLLSSLPETNDDSLDVSAKVSIEKYLKDLSSSSVDL